MQVKVVLLIGVGARNRRLERRVVRQGPAAARPELAFTLEEALALAGLVLALDLVVLAERGRDHAVDDHELVLGDGGEDALLGRGHDLIQIFLAVHGHQAGAGLELARLDDGAAALAGGEPVC